MLGRTVVGVIAAYKQQYIERGLGLDDLSLAWPAVVQLVVSLARSGVWFSQEYFSLFYHSDQFDFYVVAMVH